MERIDAADFNAPQPWGSRLLMDMNQHAAKLHWTNAAYRWHRNAGEELFVVLHGTVRMHWRNNKGQEGFEDLCAGDAMKFNEGDEHYAEPRPEARVLVIERKDSEQGASDA